MLVFNSSFIVRDQDMPAFHVMKYSMACLMVLLCDRLGVFRHPLIIVHDIFFAVRISGYLLCDISGMNIEVVNIGYF